MPKVGQISSSSKPKDYSPEFIVGDCISVMTHMAKEGRRFDFIFADPPFNMGQEYNEYDDSIPAQRYNDFTDNWINRAFNCLADSGVMAIHGPDGLIEPYLRLMATYSRSIKRIAWINWHYRFGQCNRNNWIDARCHCLIYAKEPYNYIWNPDDVLVQSDRAAVYGDKRIGEYENGGMRLPGTVWGIPSDGPYWGRVQGNSTERRKGHPNQLPCVYLARLIRAYTNSADGTGRGRILDPFCGSGTTASVAQELGRQATTIDISQESIASARERCTDIRERNVSRERLGLPKIKKL